MPYFVRYSLSQAKKVSMGKTFSHSFVTLFNHSAAVVLVS